MPRSAQRTLPITLVVDHRAWLKLMTYVRLCPAEINGFGYVQRVDNRTLRLSDPDDVFITKQRVTMASADVDPETFGRAQYAAVLAGRETELHLQWHSHVDGDAYLSSIDIENIDEFGDLGADWLLSLVLNKRGEWAAQVDTFAPYRSTIPAVLHIDYSDAPALDACVQAQIDELVEVQSLPRLRHLQLVYVDGDAGEADELMVVVGEGDNPDIIGLEDAVDLFGGSLPIGGGFRVARDLEVEA